MRHTISTHGGLAARFGGEEFVVLLRVGSISDALRIAEDLRVGVERIEIESEVTGRTVSCTTSIGVAVHEAASPPSLSDMLKRADAALYEAKDAGRNRFKLAA